MPITKSLAFKKDGEDHIRRPEMRKTLRFHEMHRESNQKGNKADGEI